MPHRVTVDRPTAIEGADARQQIAERNDALHRRRLEPERVSNLVHAATGFDQRNERFPLAHLVGPDTREIFKHRRFERIVIIPLVEDSARDRHNSAALTRTGVVGCTEQAPVHKTLSRREGKAAEGTMKYRW